MPHLKRFYCADAAPGDKIILDQAQSNHLKNVLRLKTGSTVEVFNSCNESFLAEVLSISPKGGVDPALARKGWVELKILSEITPSSNLPPIDITLACAIAKGSRMDWLVEKAAEIGLTRLIPIITERTVVHPVRDRSRLWRDRSKETQHTNYIGHQNDNILSNTKSNISNGVKPNAYSQNKIARWHKLAIAAAKQTGQNSVLAIDNPIPFRQLENIISYFSLSLIAAPNADKYLPEVLEKGNLTSKDKILYLIGPEGDFTKEEAATAIKWGIQPVRLPVNSILRVETAALTMLAMILYQRAQMKDKR